MDDEKALRRQLSDLLNSEAAALQRAIQLSDAGGSEFHAAMREADLLRHERTKVARMLRDRQVGIVREYDA